MKVWAYKRVYTGSDLKKFQKGDVRILTSMCSRLVLKVRGLSIR